MALTCAWRLAGVYPRRLRHKGPCTWERQDPGGTHGCDDPGTGGGASEDVCLSVVSGCLEAVDRRLLGREWPAVPSLYAEELSSASVSAGAPRHPDAASPGRAPCSGARGVCHRARTHSLRAGHAPVTLCVTPRMWGSLARSVFLPAPGPLMLRAQVPRGP